MTATPTQVPASPWLDVARRKLERVLGPAKAAAVTAEILGELGLATLSSSEQLAAFGERLALREGFLGALGVSIQTHAMLRKTRAKL